jgi:zinc protease
MIRIFGNADGMHFTFVGNVDLSNARPLFEKVSWLTTCQTGRTYCLKITVQDLYREPCSPILKKEKESPKCYQCILVGETQYSREGKYCFQSSCSTLLNIKIVEKLREENERYVLVED